MSNNHGTLYENFVPGLVTTVGATQVENVLFELPAGREAAVQVRTQLDDPAVREAQLEEYLSTVYPPALTEGLEKELTQLTERLNEITGYDRNGKPQYRLTGRDREIAEMKAANRRNALVGAQQNRARAERIQAQARTARAEQTARIDAAARAKAQELVEQAEINRRAAQIAARVSGVRD